MTLSRWIGVAIQHKYEATATVSPPSAGMAAIRFCKPASDRKWERDPILRAFDIKALRRLPAAHAACGAGLRYRLVMRQLNKRLPAVAKKKNPDQMSLDLPLSQGGKRQRKAERAESPTRVIKIQDVQKRRKRVEDSKHIRAIIDLVRHYD